MNNTSKIFNPGPKWRATFAFTVSYPNLDKEYSRDTVLAPSRREPEFVLDPVLNKFNLTLVNGRELTVK